MLAAARQKKRLLARINICAFILTLSVFVIFETAICAQDATQSGLSQLQTIPEGVSTPIRQGDSANQSGTTTLNGNRVRPTLNIWQPPEFFANPNINITPLESAPRFNRFDLPNYQMFKKRVHEERGLDYLFAYTPLAQFGEGGRDFFDAELDFGFVKSFCDDGCKRSNLLMYMLWVQTFSANPTGAFSQPYGVAIQPNSGSTDPNQGLVQLNLLAWEQTWRDDSISLRVGQLRNDFFFGTNKYHNDDRYVFVNSVLSGLQGINWAATGKGLGAMLDFRNETYYATFGFSDAKGNQNYPDFNSFFDTRFSYLGEVGWTPKNAENEGEYKCTLSFTDKTGDPSDVGQRSGYGLILSARQDFYKRVGLSLRWNKSFERFNSGLTQSLATGLTFTGIGQHKDDWISCGWFWGDPIDATLNEENGMEIYWRAQLTKNIELTPDLLVYFDKAGQPGTSYFGALRVRFIF